MATDSSSDSPRRTGKAPRQLRIQPRSGFLNISRFAMKKIGAFTEQPIANGSRKLRWLDARMTPPAGTCSRPSRRTRKYRRSVGLTIIRIGQ